MVLCVRTIYVVFAGNHLFSARCGFDLDRLWRRTRLERCTVPAFGADKGKALAACEAILARFDINDADRERALITAGRAAHMTHDLPKAISPYSGAVAIGSSPIRPRSSRNDIEL
jgi:hypothetical protein